MEELTVEQRTQAVIDFNKWVDAIAPSVSTMSQEDKELLAERVAQRKQELGIE